MPPLWVTISNSGWVGFWFPCIGGLLRSDVTLPWLIGLLSLLWIGLAVFLVVRIFRMENRKLIFLTAGIFTANVTVSAIAATYVHDLDCDMLSLLCAVAAVWLWQEWKWGWLPGAALLAASIGLYQSFLFTAVTLVMFRCVLWLLEKESFWSVLLRGLKAIAMILFGGIGYSIALKLITSVLGFSLYTGGTNTLHAMESITAQNLLPLILQTYRDFFTRLWNAPSVYSSVLVRAMTLGLCLISLLAFGAGLRKMQWKEGLLLLVLVILFPLGAHMIYVLSVGACHDLMVYAIWIFWLLPLLLADWMCRNGKSPIALWPKRLAMVMVALLLYGNVMYANGLYVKKELEQTSCLSLMTRVVDRMEQFEGYVAGETTVVFYGTPPTTKSVIPGFEDYQNVTGMAYNSPIGTLIQDSYRAYFDYILNIPIALADDDVWNAILESSEAAAMPVYPAEGSLAMIDGFLVVKLDSIPE